MEVQDALTRNWVCWQFGTFFENIVARFDTFVADTGGARWVRYETCNVSLAFPAEGAFQRIGIPGTLVLSHGRLESIKPGSRQSRFERSCATCSPSCISRM